MGRSRERMLALVAFGRVVPCWRWGGVSAVPVGMGHSIFLEEWERGTGAGCMKVATEWGGGGGESMGDTAQILPAEGRGMQPHPAGLRFGF